MRRRRARRARSRPPPRPWRGGVPRPSPARRRPPLPVSPSCAKPSGIGFGGRERSRRPYTRRMHVERAIVLPTTPRGAWSVLVDWERQADWMLDADRVEVVSDLREGVGVRLAVRTRLLGVPTFTEPMEVTVWEPPRRL